jgi:hypothetical protein
MSVPKTRNPGSVKAETEKKNAELAHQQELAEESRIAMDEKLGKRDKTEADSFPASDPPTPP